MYQKIKLSSVILSNASSLCIKEGTSAALTRKFTRNTYKDRATAIKNTVNAQRYWADGPLFFFPFFAKRSSLPLFGNGLQKNHMLRRRRQKR